MTPRTPPKAITTGKVTGSTQIAGAPELGAPHSDRDHGNDVVEPETGGPIPATKPPPTSPWPTWASATAGASR